VIASAVGTYWSFSNQEAAYLMETSKGSLLDNLVPRAGTWVLIFTNFVPISLLVTLELVKFWQGSFMQYDLSMFDNGVQMSVNCSSINEELG
jgi:phospholipid-transporting ATPase